jgi:hypothetical protein
MSIPAKQLEHVCSAYHGEKGRFAYRAFEWANATIYDGELPTPLIQFALTPYGGACAVTHSRPPEQPVITIHPSLWSGKGWDGIEPGPGEVLDAVIHELLHTYVDYVHADSDASLRRAVSRSSHDNRAWAELVERFSPRVPGLERGVQASCRVSVRSGGTVRKVVPEGAISLKELSQWPASLRPHGATRFWERQGLPFAW